MANQWEKSGVSVSADDNVFFGYRDDGSTTLSYTDKKTDKRMMTSFYWIMEHKDYRQDEIQDAASLYVGEDFHERSRADFVAGAGWADTHPKKGMVSIEEVVDWLAHNWEDYAYNYGIDDAIYSLRIYFKHR